MDAICMGELFLDMFAAEKGRRLSEVSAFFPTPGGAAANVAVQITRLGGSCGFIGKVGDEAFGHHLAEVLKQEGVDCRGIRFDPQARTTTNFIALPDENSAEWLFYRNPGADMRLRPEELDREMIRQCRAFYFGSLGLIDEPLRSATREAVQTAQVAGEMIVFDANYRPSLWRSEAHASRSMLDVLKWVDILKVNEIELPLLAGQEKDIVTASRMLLDMGPALVAVTLGPKGSFYQCEAGSGWVPGFAVTTVEASGCGDAFVGSLMVKLLEKPDWRAGLSPDCLAASLRFANAAGALTATRKGVIPALPNTDMVEAFLKSHQIL